MDTIRWYISKASAESLDKDIKKEVRSDVEWPGFTRYFFEKRFSFLDNFFGRYASDIYEVSAIVRFCSDASLRVGFYAKIQRKRDNVQTYEQALAEYNVPLATTDDAIAVLEIEDITAQRYVLSIRARKESILREMVIKIRQGTIKPVTPFDGSVDLSGKEEEK
jgi:putative methionine-R-sulfoxide reductase with GAF domain